MSDSVVKYSLGEIRPIHREIARRLVVGQKPSEVRASLGLSSSRFSIITNSPLFKVEVKKLEMQRDQGVVDVTKTFKELSPIAIEQIERIMYVTKDEHLKVKCAESILDRAGYGKVTKTDVNISGTVTHSTLTKDEIRQLIRDRLDRMKADDEDNEARMVEAESMEVDFTEPATIDDNGVENLPTEWCPPAGHKDGNGNGDS